ncbi:hypothetical protein ABQF33_11660 [Mycolicibacterium sp. XJ2]
MLLQPLEYRVQSRIVGQCPGCLSVAAVALGRLGSDVPSAVQVVNPATLDAARLTHVLQHGPGFARSWIQQLAALWTLGFAGHPHPLPRLHPRYGATASVTPHLRNAAQTYNFNRWWICSFLSGQIEVSIGWTPPHPSSLISGGSA